MMTSIKFEIPAELLPYLSDDPQSKLKQLVVFELYRENKLTLRQAAEILEITYREMQELLAKSEVYLDYTKNELEDEINYGFSRK